MVEHSRLIFPIVFKYHVSYNQVTELLQFLNIGNTILYSTILKSALIFSLLNIIMNNYSWSIYHLRVFKQYQSTENTKCLDYDTLRSEYCLTPSIKTGKLFFSIWKYNYSCCCWFSLLFFFIQKTLNFKSDNACPWKFCLNGTD